MIISCILEMSQIGAVQIQLPHGHGKLAQERSLA